MPSRGLRAKAHLAIAAGLGSRVGRSEQLYWTFPANAAFAETAQAIRADLYVANDWKVLPAAARAARAVGGRYAYDSHEYAVEEGGDRLLWRALFPRYVQEIEGRYIGDAALVCTVGAGIADLLQRAYGLTRQPLVVRNIPGYQETDYRPPGDKIVVLYHGIFAADRCLQELIDSVTDWDPRYRLVLRGFGKPGMERALRSRVASSPASSRIELAPRVQMTDLIRCANQADIGIFATPGTTNHTQFCLPNKVFEYVMAGLALCVSNNAEMGALVREWDLGVLIHTPSPSGIADAIGRLTPEAVTDFKRRAHKAAQTLNWEQEREVLLAAVADL